MQLAPQTVQELQNAAGFDRFHDQLPALIQDGDRNRFLVNVQPDILNTLLKLLI
jgi:hypothetical protein